MNPDFDTDKSQTNLCEIVISVLELDAQCLTKASAFRGKEKSSILTQKGSLQ